MKTHKMDEHLENMFDNVNHLIECKQFVMEKVKFLEDKRLELTNVIKNLSASSYKETLENKINTMEMKLSINCVTDQINNKEEVIDKFIEKKNTKCRYNNRGFCKSQIECVYFHSDQICDKVLSNGQCTESKTCLQRHPRDCKHWMGDPRGCLRGIECKYLHNPSNKGRNIKTNKSQQATKSEGLNKKEDKEVIIDKKVDKVVDSFKESLATKDNEIKQKEDEILKLKSENKDLFKENEKIKRCAINMDKEIKVLRSRTN